MTDDTAARKARAESLHQQINRLIKPSDVADSESAVDTHRGETPAEFVHRKMHELDKKKE